MDNNDFKKDWIKLSSLSISSKENLSDFLKDYSKIFSGTLNPSCPSCLNEYIIKLKKYMRSTKVEKEATDYILLSKREGLPLVFGSDILLTNDNLTNEYAETLFNRLKEIKPSLTMEEVFKKFPDTSKKTKPAKDKPKNNLEKKSNDELSKVATALGVKVEGSENKAELLEIIEVAKKGINQEVINPIELGEKEEELEVIELENEENILDPIEPEDEVIDIDDIDSNL